MGNGESELPSPGERVQAGSDYRSQLSSLPQCHWSRPWTSTPPAHRILVYSLGIRQTAFTHFLITRIRKTTPERTPSPSMRTRVSGEPLPPLIRPAYDMSRLPTSSKKPLHLPTFVVNDKGRCRS